MPCTAPSSTSFAARKAWIIVALRPSTVISFSFGIVISESQCWLEFVDALERHLHAATAFERERLGDHRDGEDPHLLGELRHDGRRARAGAAAHAGGDEHHVRALQGVHDAFAIFQRRLAADFRIRARAQALGDVAAELQLQLRAAVLDRLRVGVRRDEFHAVHAAVDHVRDRVAAATADADDLDHRVRGHLFNQFEMRHVRVLVIGVCMNHVLRTAKMFRRRPSALPAFLRTRRDTSSSTC